MKSLLLTILTAVLCYQVVAQIDNPEAEAVLITKLGDEYLRAGEYEMAIYYYRNALKIYPGYVKTQFQLAQCYRLSLNADSAAHHYKAIIDNDQDRRYPMSRYHLAMMQLDNNDHKSAEANLLTFQRVLFDNRLHELKKYRDFYRQASLEIDKLKSK